jgi:hypothetical protein
MSTADRGGIIKIFPVVNMEVQCWYSCAADIAAECNCLLHHGTNYTWEGVAFYEDSMNSLVCLELCKEISFIK